VPDGALQREMSHGHRRAGIAGVIFDSAFPRSTAVSSRSLGVDDCQDRLKDVLVLPDRLAERPSSPVASQSSAACQTV
jgi:hypothetical protein